MKKVERYTPKEGSKGKHNAQRKRITRTWMKPKQVEQRWTKEHTTYNKNGKLEDQSARNLLSNNSWNIKRKLLKPLKLRLENASTSWNIIREEGKKCCNCQGKMHEHHKTEQPKALLVQNSTAKKSTSMSNFTGKLKTEEQKDRQQSPQPSQRWNHSKQKEQNQRSKPKKHQHWHTTWIRHDTDMATHQVLQKDTTRREHFIYIFFKYKYSWAYKHIVKYYL